MLSPNNENFEKGDSIHANKIHELQQRCQRFFVICSNLKNKIEDLEE
jgi:hypothetical protein